jgi:hypothetical protein
MCSAYRCFATWILAAWVAAVAGIGEGWRAVPGNGHWVQLPNGFFVCLGRTLDARQICLLENREPKVDRGQADALTLKGEADCAICRSSGEHPFQNASLDISPATFFVQFAPVLDSSLCCNLVSRAFDARAPPDV